MSITVNWRAGTKGVKITADDWNYNFGNAKTAIESLDDTIDNTFGYLEYFFNDILVSGCATTPGTGVAVAIAEGIAYVNSTFYGIAAQELSITKPGAGAYTCAIIVNSSGVVAEVTGDTAHPHTPPNTSADQLRIANVYVEAADVGFDADDIDERLVYTAFDMRDTIDFVDQLKVIDAYGLYCYFNAGEVHIENTYYSISAATLLLADNDTNYVYVGDDGAVADNITGFPNVCVPLAEVITSGGDISSISDKRAFLNNSGLLLDTVGTPTYSTGQDWLNSTQSSGRISNCCPISDAGSGKIDIAALSGFIKTTDSEIGDTVLFDFAGASDVVLTDNDVNYVYIDYNGGTPQVVVTLDRTSIEWYRHFTLGRVYRSGTDLHILNSGVNLPDFFRKAHERWLVVRGFERATGGVVSETGNRYLDVTAGSFYLGLNNITTSAQDTSGAERFTYWYNDGAWQSVTGQQQISNSQYNNYGVGLANLTGLHYGVHWVYIHYDSAIHVLYGVGDYTLAEAEAASAPSNVPDAVNDFGILAAKIIILKTATNFTSVVTAYTTVFPVSSPANHNDLGGLQGGQATEYYHLKSSEYTGTGTGDFVRKDAPTLTGQAIIPTIDLTGGQIKFPASQSASADANTLDDYEEGTWTPNVGGDATYTTQTGRYIKEGKKVTVWGEMVINVLGTGSTTTLSGLPSTVVNAGLVQSGSVGYFASLAVNVLFISLYAGSNGTTILFTSAVAAVATITNTPAIFGNSASIIFSLTYEATA